MVLQFFLLEYQTKDVSKVIQERHLPLMPLLWIKILHLLFEIQKVQQYKNKLAISKNQLYPRNMYNLNRKPIYDICECVYHIFLKKFLSSVLISPKSYITSNLRLHRQLLLKKALLPLKLQSQLLQPPQWQQMFGKQRIQLFPSTLSLSTFRRSLSFPTHPLYNLNFPFNYYQNYFPSIHKDGRGDKNEKNREDILGNNDNIMCGRRYISIGISHSLVRKYHRNPMIEPPVIIPPITVSPPTPKSCPIHINITPNTNTNSNAMNPPTSISIHLNRLSVIDLKTLWVSLSGIDFSHFDTPPDGDALPFTIDSIRYGRSESNVSLSGYSPQLSVITNISRIYIPTPIIFQILLFHLIFQAY